MSCCCAFLLNSMNNSSLILDHFKLWMDELRHHKLCHIVFFFGNYKDKHLFLLLPYLGSLSRSLFVLAQPPSAGQSLGLTLPPLSESVHDKK